MVGVSGAQEAAESAWWDHVLYDAATAELVVGQEQEPLAVALQVPVQVPLEVPLQVALAVARCAADRFAHGRTGRNNRSTVPPETWPVVSATILPMAAQAIALKPRLIPK